MKHTLFTIGSLFNLKKQKRFLNITEYKFFLIKASFKYVWEPFPHLKRENGSERGIGMDCPAISIHASQTDLILLLFLEE